MRPTADRRRTLFVSLLACIWTSLSASALAAVPAQFIAKIYTEALGRAPDPAGWNSALSYFTSNGCSQSTLKDWGSAVFNAAEFNGIGYDNPATTLVLYRAILNREPDSAGYNQWLRALDSGQSLQSVVASLFDTQEFGQLVPYICSGNSYSFGTLGTGLAIAIPTSRQGGYGNLTESQLQDLLNSTPAGQTIYLQQKSFVLLTQPLVIPAGVTVATSGLPTPQQHGFMARLVRAAPFAGPLVQINLDNNANPAGALKNVWVDGQRQLSSTFVSGAINIEIYGGTGATVDSNFISNTLGWSNIHSYGSLDGRPCSSNTITNNVVTAYSSLHANQQWADGISVGCENTLVENNQIVDPTDVGIVVFTAYPATQRSVVTHNTVISAGNSAFGAMGFDPLQGRSAGAPDFTGSTISDNTLWSGPNTHFIIGLAVGSRPWYSQGSIGYGAEATGNTTGGIQTRFGAGIVVSGMNDATVQSNVFEATAIQQSWTGCPIGNVLASVSAGLASGSLQQYSDVKVDGCMSDYSPSAAAQTAGTTGTSSQESAGSSTATAAQAASASGGAAQSGGGGALGAPALIVLAMLLGLRGTAARRESSPES